jgi:endogenous inhibitor of DNA gyrase (YacG/DUF329 family)
MSLVVKCPICRRPVEQGAENFPFCSERCRVIDLGAWASEAYRLPVTGQAPPEAEVRRAAEEDES